MVNAAMWSFFSSLKTERLSRKVYRTRDAARAEVFDYIGDGFVCGFEKLISVTATPASAAEMPKV